MFLKNIDLISPKITLFHKGRDKHFNIFSGFLALLAYMIIFASSIYFSLDFFLKRHPTAYFFKRYVEDAGSFSFDSLSMFHYITIGVYPVDFESVQIIGIPLQIAVYESGVSNWSEFEHWEYGPCESSDMKGFEKVGVPSDFIFGACIKRVWRVEDQKYYSQEDEKFFYPHIDHGSSHPNHTFYGIIVQQCNNATGIPNANYHCKSSAEIKKYIIEKVFLSINLIDNYIDVGNYSTPSIKYFYKLSNSIFDETYTQNHLNFNPALIRTHKGIIFEVIEEEKSYVFEQNEKLNSEPGKMQILSCFYFWMQNRLQFYDRTYIRIQDVLANIGGVSKLILAIAVIINYFFNYYAIVFSTSKLFQLDYRESNSKEFQKVPHGNSYSNSNIDFSNNTPFFKKEQGYSINNFLQNNNNLQKSNNIYGQTIHRNLSQNKSFKWDIKFKDFLKSLYCSKFMKDKKIKAKYDILIKFRKVYLSEEFLSQSYLYYENHKGAKRKKFNNFLISNHFSKNKDEQVNKKKKKIGS